ncbi:MAG: adenylyl-sulfate kinase [Nitrospira sp.]|nr:adenylyl-sulfate kinase [Nitrospira sp.]
MSMQSKDVPNVVRHPVSLMRAHRESRNGHRGVIVWLTGLSGSGKSTLAYSVEEVLHGCGFQTVVLDGDHFRHGLCRDLGFSPQDRRENIRRVGEVAKLFMETGTIVLTAFISPYRADREKVRGLVGFGDFIEVYCNASIEVCEGRDPKGLYRKARLGQIAEFTGISSPYEVPYDPEITVDSGVAEVGVCVQQIIVGITKRGICQLPLASR